MTTTTIIKCQVKRNSSLIVAVANEDLAARHGCPVGTIVVVTSSWDGTGKVFISYRFF